MRKKSWPLALSIAAVWILFYLPLLFGPKYGHITVFENLDGEFICNRIVGVFYRDPATAKHLMLGGRIPLFLLQRIDWPLSLINLIHSHYVAFILSDLIVRLIGFAGMLWLARFISRSEVVSLLAAFLFAFSISFTVFGLSVAAIPAVIYLTQRAADGAHRPWHVLLLFLLGWNSALVLSGLFLLITLPYIRYVLFGRANHRTLIRGYLPYATGLIVGSAGLFYATLIHFRLQRLDWHFSGLGWKESIVSFFANQFAWSFWDFYHVTSPLLLVYIAIIATLLVTRARRIAALLSLIVAIEAFYVLVHSQRVSDLRNAAGGILLEIQFDRFYFLLSSLLVITWIICVISAKGVLRKTLLVAGVLQLAVVFVRAPQMEAITPKFVLFPSPAFADHFLERDYAQIRAVVGNDSVMSVGLDPMVAVANGISSIDGYYVAYPLAYKHSFRKIIERQLPLAGPAVADSYDHWGNRVYTFAYDPSRIALDYCAAQHENARYVLSRFPLNDKHLKIVLTTTPTSIVVYRLEACY